MKVLVVTPWFPDSPGEQAGNFVLDSVEALVGAGHRVHVIVVRPWLPRSLAFLRPEHAGSPTAQLLQRGFTLELVRFPAIPGNRLRVVSNAFFLARCAPAVGRAVQQFRPDVIHAHTEYASVAACRAGRAAGVPVVTTIHGINDAPRYLAAGAQRRFLQEGFSSPDRLVLVGDRLREFAAGLGAPPGKVRVVPNGFHPELAAPWHGKAVLQDPCLRIVSVSNLVPGKGVDTTLSALEIAQRQGIGEWEYDIVGDGVQREALQAQAARSGLSQRVRFHGRVSREDVFAMLGRSDLFCLPSSPEAFGIAYLEAMACGLLAVACRGEGPATFIEHGRTGWLVPPGDATALAEALVTIAREREPLRSIADAGRRRVWSDYTWQGHAQQLVRVFEEAAAGHARAEAAQ